jgi:hypothetical protein
LTGGVTAAAISATPNRNDALWVNMQPP